MMAKIRPRSARRPPDIRPSNRLLAALPVADYRRILPSLTQVPLKHKQVLHKQGETIDTVYFVGGGVASLINVMTDGRMVEVATIGNEGIVGITVFLGGTISPGEIFIQVADGLSDAMPVDAFRRELDRRGAFYDVVSRYSQALQLLMMQSTACNSLHSVEERCSKWLLMTHDRVVGDELRLTHEFLGYMLGVRRPSVSLILGQLDRAGIIRNGTKRITVINRTRLEGVSCECYEVAKKAFDRLLPNPRNERNRNS